MPIQHVTTLTPQKKREGRVRFLSTACNPYEVGGLTPASQDTKTRKGGTMKASRVKSIARKIVVCLIAAAGVMTATGCEEYDYLFGPTDWSGAGFRLGNFNQGLSPHVDCIANPWDPRC